MIPDATKHRKDPKYVRALYERIGKSQKWIADRIGISERRFRYLIAGSREVEGKTVDVVLSYPEQFALECLAEAADMAGAMSIK
ncbi:hypothetical protein LMG28138_01800 [Pararobbsia alpina]|uniref:HTH cro/C1-type domain-containing protein n=1 Tax=Pararobbsia alpina TaxID=621374 RepID=A0A6S7BBF5_9BURK|nr:hypothetical protein LMG28138_01800 [Pararobbsia alpina]